MADMGTRITFRLEDEMKRESMSIAAMQGIYGFSEVLRQALALWITRERVREEIHKWMSLYENDCDEPTAEFADILHKLMEAGEK